MSNRCCTRKELATGYGLSVYSFKRLLDKLGYVLPVRRVLTPGEVKKIVGLMEQRD